MGTENPLEGLDIPLPLGGDAGKMGLIQIIENIETRR